MPARKRKQTAVAVVDPVVVTPAITPDQMLLMAVEGGADMDKLEKLMDLKDRWDKNEARKAFVRAMAAFKARAPEIVKDKHVSYSTSKGLTEYNHASLGHVVKIATTEMSKHGLSHAWKTNQHDGIEVVCIITHVDGHSESVSLKAPSDQSGGKNSIQAIASTVTYLERYTFLAATGLATEEDDDGRGGALETITEDQVMEISGMLADRGISVDEFTDWTARAWGVGTLAEIPESKYSKAIAGIKARKKPERGTV